MANANGVLRGYKGPLTPDMLKQVRGAEQLLRYGGYTTLADQLDHIIRAGRVSYSDANNQYATTQAGERAITFKSRFFLWGFDAVSLEDCSGRISRIAFDHYVLQSGVLVHELTHTEQEPVQWWEKIIEAYGPLFGKTSDYREVEAYQQEINWYRRLAHVFNQQVQAGDPCIPSYYEDTIDSLIDDAKMAGSQYLSRGETYR